jgi:hypothetical protein
VFCSAMVAIENSMIARPEIIPIVKPRIIRVACGAPQRVQMWARWTTA